MTCYLNQAELAVDDEASGPFLDQRLLVLVCTVPYTYHRLYPYYIILVNMPVATATTSAGKLSFTQVSLIGRECHKLT